MIRFQLMIGPGLPFDRFDGQISQLWSLLTTSGRQKMILPKKQELIEFWLQSEKLWKKENQFLTIDTQSHIDKGLIVLRCLRQQIFQNLLANPWLSFRT